jgi:translation initiation factor IF-2
MKVRLYKIASDVGIQNADLVKKCRMLGFNVRNHMSTIEEAEVQVVKRAIERERQKPVKEKVLRAGVLLRKGVHKPKPAVTEEAPAAAAAPAPSTSVPAEMPAAPAAGSGWPSDAAAEPAPALAEAASTAASVQEAATEVPSPSPAEAPEVVEPAREAGEPVPAEEADQAGDAGGMPRIVGRIELPKPLAKVASKPAPKATVESEAAKQRVAARKGDARRPARRIEEMRASAVPAWDARAKRPRKKKVAPGTKTKKTEITTPKAIKRVVRIEGQISLQELAKAMEVKATEVLMRLIKLGMTGVNINSSLDVDTAKIVATEFNYEVEDVSFEEDGLIQAAASSTEVADEAKLASRAPVVTVMGHVDHGKTSLLDYIRKSRVAKGEAGGITQSIGASEISTDKGRVVFIDTPGHEAFTEMRARGAQVTDVVVLVVAANDGVQAQTVESINHAKAAEVPIVVAVNKMDLPNANPERVRKELADHDLLSEDWGGETLFAEVSAETGQGVDRLLENLLLQAEMLDLKCNPDRPAHGSVIEAKLDKGKGPVASVLVTDGTLITGDNIVAGATFGRVRAMTNHLGKPVQQAEPSTAVEILGLNNVPLASDPVDAVADLKKAQLVADSRADKIAAAGAAETGGTALTDILSKIQAGEKAELKVILKADVQGSLEAVKAAILKLGTEKVGTSVIHASVGGITESDVNLASASGALIVGFNVRPAGKARRVAISEKVDIRMYTVIYDLLDDMRKSMIGMLEPVLEEVYLGKALVKQTFNISKLGTVAGCEITEGKVTRTASVRLVRDSAVVWTGKIGSLRHFKDDVKEVVAGLECGISIEGYNDIKAGDEMECFEEQEREATLE